jgi:hypothetical protein
MYMTDKIIELHKQGYGRRRISAELGISERKIRKTLSEYKMGRIEQISKEVKEKIDASFAPDMRTKIRYAQGQPILERVLELTDELHTTETIMEAFRVDPDKWECVTYNLNPYQMMHKDADNNAVVTNLYSATLRVKPIKGALDLDRQLAKIATLEPMQIEVTKTDGYGLAEIGVTDAHFGINTFADYADTLKNIIRVVDAAETVLLIMGSDNLHANNFQGTTVKGTVLETTDLNQAFEDAYKFFSTIIYQSIVRGKDIHVKYLRGNHDETTSFLLCKTLEKVFPQAHYDLEMSQYKGFRYGDVGIGLTHGDMGKRGDFDRIFRKELPDIFGTAKTIELHYGHVHQEGVKDVYGDKIRSLPTGTKRSGWTKDNGYFSVEVFQCFLYGKDRLMAIHYV